MYWHPAAPPQLVARFLGRGLRPVAWFRGVVPARCSACRQREGRRLRREKEILARFSLRGRNLLLPRGLGA